MWEHDIYDIVFVDEGKQSAGNDSGISPAGAKLDEEAFQPYPLHRVSPRPAMVKTGA